MRYKNYITIKETVYKVINVDSLLGMYTLIIFQILGFKIDFKL